MLLLLLLLLLLLHGRRARVEKDLEGLGDLGLDAQVDFNEKAAKMTPEQRIKARNYPLTQEPRDESFGGRSLTLDDPDGFHLSIYRPA